MSRYKGIIFDLDGTLLDTLEDISDSVNLALKDFNYPTHSYEEYKIFLGNGFRVLIEKSVPQGTDKERIDEILDLFKKNYKKNFQNKTKPYDEILDMIENLDEKGIKLAVNTNKRDDYAKPLINKFFNHISFVAAFGERQDIPNKPNPTSANEIIELMGLNKEEVLYVGDSNTDILTANNANLDSIGVTWGFRSEDELIKTGATYIANKPKDIIHIVKNSNI